MDIVYLLKEGDQNEELRYSLRSLKNLPHDEVHVAGYLPKWVKGVNYIPLGPYKAPEGERHKKWYISWQMFRVLCAHDDLPDDFILFNDDFFVMKPATSIPILHRGQIGDVIGAYRRRNPNKSNVFITAMEETRDLLVELRKPTLCYEMHLPMTINRHQMLSAQETVEAMERKHINKRTLYGNYWEIGGRKAEDVKVRFSNHFSVRDTFLSTSDASWKWSGSQGVQHHIRRQFRKRSPYER